MISITKTRGNSKEEGVIIENGNPTKKDNKREG